MLKAPGTTRDDVELNARKECARYWGFDPDWPLLSNVDYEK